MSDEKSIHQPKKVRRGWLSAPDVISGSPADYAVRSWPLLRWLETTFYVTYMIVFVLLMIFLVNRAGFRHTQKFSLTYFYLKPAWSWLKSPDLMLVSEPYIPLTSRYHVQWSDLPLGANTSGYLYKEIPQVQVGPEKQLYIPYFHPARMVLMEDRSLWNTLRQLRRWEFPILFVDEQDYQWRSFHTQLGFAIPGLLLYAFISRVARWFCQCSGRGVVPNTSTSSSPSALINTDLSSSPRIDVSPSPKRHRIYMWILNGINIPAFMYLHGTGIVVIPLCLHLIHFYICSRQPLWWSRWRGQPFRKMGWPLLICVWVPQLLILGWCGHLVLSTAAGDYQEWVHSWSPHWLWRWSGLFRFEVAFNMHVLRMIAYTYDYWEAHILYHAVDASQGLTSAATTTDPSVMSSSARDSTGGDAVLEDYDGPPPPPPPSDGIERRRRELIIKHRTSCLECAETSPVPCYKLRTDASRPLSEYQSLSNYVAYCFYTPLLIAGPMTSFNAFLSHSHLPQRAFGIRRFITYTFRLLCRYAVLTVLLHLCHINLLREAKDVFSSLSIGEKIAVMYLTLAFLWLKFGIIWGFFRLMAALEGTESPEDMRRCFSDTVTVSDFWRDWHASFNLWIVRYMYVPMGGSSLRVLAIFPIFGFIAFWHDHSMNLFGWALCILAAFVPEILIMDFFRRPSLQWVHQAPWFRYLCAVGGVGTMSFLILANTVGYGVGANQSTEGMLQMFSWGHLTLLGWMWVTFFVGVQLGLLSRGVAALKERSRRLMLFAASGKGGPSPV